MFTNVLKLKSLIYIFRALFLLVTSFYIRIIISSLLAAHWISIIIVLYNLNIPFYFITFDMPASGQYAIVKYRSTKLPIVIYPVGAVLFI
jgi:hypothetical protein